MRFEFAPMEGVTDDIFRRLHCKYFPGVDRYYTPFLSPSSRKVFAPRELREVAPENNPGLTLVPQMLTDNPKLFVAGAKILGDLGYREVNLNLGCPSGTVTAKGRGAGLLYPERRAALRALLDGIFSDCPLDVSIKTRLGKADPAEFRDLLDLFSEYPVKALILHPRVREDLYRVPARMEWLDYALDRSPFPVILSGGIAAEADFSRAFAGRPGPEAVMLGRGLVADPALVRKLQGGPGADRETLRAFLTELFQETALRLGSPRSTMFRMKEIWSYCILLFGHREKHWRALRKATTLSEYESVTARIFRDLPLRDTAEITWS